MRHEAWGMGREETNGDGDTDAVALAVALYEATQAFPPDERLGLTAQVRRAGVSIPSNIAEGWGRGARADYARFLRMARGSLYEVRTQLVIARTIGLLSPDGASALDSRIESVRRQLHALLGAVERSA